MGRIDQRLKELSIELPAKALVPRANALQWRRTGDLVFVSGQGPAWDGEIVMTGRLGESLSVEKGQEAARLAALNVLFQLRQACDGNLDRVKCCVMVQAYVRCTDAFAEQPIVMNGASNLIVDVFGEAGKHARVAIGCNALPRDMPVEVAAIFEIGD